MSRSGISIQVGKSGNDSRQWLRAQIPKNTKSKLDALGTEMTTSLKAATPTRSGKLAAGWTHETKSTAKGKELVIYNTAYPEVEGNLALLVDRGHGTKNGGYVVGKNYIRPAIKSGISKFTIDYLTK